MARVFPKYFFKYKEAVDYLAGFQLKSRTEYREWRKKMPWRFPLPANPELYYKEFKGWKHFLSSDFISFDELLALTKMYRVASIGGYRDFARDLGPVLNIPVYPEVVYENFQGFNYLIVNDENCLSCASQWAFKNGFKNVTEWRRVGRSKIPKNMHIDLDKYGCIDKKKFFKGEYNDCNCSACEQLGDWER